MEGARSLHLFWEPSLFRNDSYLGMIPIQGTRPRDPDAGNGNTTAKIPGKQGVPLPLPPHLTGI